MEKVRIKQATEQGWIECEVGGVADFSYPESQYRRGRVQGGADKPYHNIAEHDDMQDRD